MKSITMQELIALKPSFANPITLVCFDGHFKSALKEITVNYIDGSRIRFRTADGDSISTVGNVLQHMTLKK